MDVTRKSVAPRSFLRRRDLIAALTSLSCVLSLARAGRADTVARSFSEEFVAELGRRAFVLLRDKRLGKRSLEAGFRKLYDEFFDAEPIAKWIAGRSWRPALSQGQGGVLRDLISEYVAKKLVVGLYDYRYASFAVTYSSRINDVEEVISDVKDDVRGRYLSLTWLLAVKGPASFRVGDVKIGGFSFLINERGHFDRLFSAAGSTVEGLLGSVRRLIEELDAIKLGT